MKYFLVILFAIQIEAATLSVPGTYATIALAAAASNPGDVVEVDSGTYVQTTISRSGSAGNFITYKAKAGATVISRGFILSGVTYIRIIGFEFTHTSTAIDSVINTTGTCNHIEILDNYAHNYAGNFVESSGTPTYFTIRGNHVYEQGIGSGGAFTQDPDTTFYMFSAGSATDHWLVEYNHIHRTGDFISIYGPNHIIRNNWLHDHDASYWNPSGWHSDMFQPGSDGANLGTRHHVYEANLNGDSLTADSHVILLNDNPGSAGDTNFVFRGNIGYNIGSVFIQVLHTDDVNTYNNTAYKMGQVASGSSPFTWYGPGDAPQNGALINTIIYDKGLPGDCILIQEGNNVTVANNIGFSAGSEASYVSTADPLFVNTNTYNFRLQSGSAARGAGRALATVTSSTGSGTSFNVTSGHGKYFTDGKGIAEGDIIRVGSTNATAVRITGISSDTITVASSISWTSGDNVYWGNYGLDIGALPYYSTALTAATYTHVGNDYTVTPTGDARMVIFSTDGIPTSIDYDSPFTATITSGTVTIKAYPLYAQETLAVTATEGSSSSSTAVIAGRPIIAGKSIAR